MMYFHPHTCSVKELIMTSLNVVLVVLLITLVLVPAIIIANTSQGGLQTYWVDYKTLVQVIFRKESIREVRLEFKRGACLIWEGVRAILFWLGIPAILLCFLVAAPFIIVYNYLRDKLAPYI